MWRWGSPARLVRCRNAAAMNPSPRTGERRWCRGWTNRPGPPGSRSRRRPRCRASSRTTAAGFPIAEPQNRDTDFGAQNVRSKPGTRRCRLRESRSPLSGSRPARTWWRSSPLTRPSSRVRRRAGRSNGRQLHRTEVVVLRTLRHRVQVVVGLAVTQRPDAQHDARPARQPAHSRMQVCVKFRESRFGDV